MDKVKCVNPVVTITLHKVINCMHGRGKLLTMHGGSSA